MNNSKKVALLLGILTVSLSLTAQEQERVYKQQIAGTVFETNSDIPVEYVNIGIVGKNIGTVSDQNGNYKLQINHENYNDTLQFSCIGYYPYSVTVLDFIHLNSQNVRLEKRSYNLTEVVVHPKKFRQKTLGITTKCKMAVECFSNNINGKEIGVLMKNKNSVFLKEVSLNIAFCTYDTIFYRINIYKAHEDMQFENILTNPVYVSSSKQEMKDKITIDLRHLNLVIDGDFLVTFEVVKDLGQGRFCFPVNFLYKAYIRETSQGSWKTYSNGASISVKVDVEKKKLINNFNH